MAQNGIGTIHKLDMYSTVTNARFNITQLISEISYYESLESPTASMTISILDATDFKHSVPILGNEQLIYSLSDTFDDNVRLFGGMRLYKLANAMRVKRDTDSYDLFFTREHMVQDQYAVVEETMGPMLASDMVENIVRGIMKSTKMLRCEKTEGLTVTTFPRVSPFTAIDMIASEAKSARGNSASAYVFYETNKAFMFSTLDALFEQKPVRTFYYLENQVKSDNAIESSRILSLEQPRAFDMMGGVASGQWGVKISSIDTISKTFASTTHLYGKSFNDTGHADGTTPLVSDQTQKELATKITREKLLVTSAGRATNAYVLSKTPDAAHQYRRRTEFAGREIVSLSSLMTSAIKIAVYGNSSLKAGDMIEIFIPATGIRKPGDVKNKLLSGKYLILALCHRFRGDGTYITTIECAKDSFSTKLSGGDF